MNTVIVDAARELPDIAPAEVPARAARLRGAAQAACIVGVRHADGSSFDWIETPHARGWLAASGAGAARDTAAWCAAFQAARAEGFVAADAAVLARTAPGDALPLLSWDAELPAAPPRRPAPPAIGLYPIVDSAERVRQVLGAGLHVVQLRIKTPPAPDAGWHAWLRGELERAIAHAAAAGGELIVNDHWRLARELGAPAIHLGQEDLLGLPGEERRQLAQGATALGISSHSLWELCRARALAPRYIACGPVWATTTKDMPWVPQGLDNLAWWCRHAGAPVVAIGGILAPEQVRQAAAAGADGVCVVRGLGVDPTRTVPALLQALQAGRRERAAEAPPLPHPTLPPGDDLRA